MVVRLNLAMRGDALAHAESIISTMPSTNSVVNLVQAESNFICHMVSSHEDYSGFLIPSHAPNGVLDAQKNTPFGGCVKVELRLY